MLSYQRRFLGQNRKVIVEENRDYQTNYLTGMTDNYIRVLMDDDDQYMGKLVTVKLEKSLNSENAVGNIL